MKLSRSMIRTIAADDLVYSRGVRLFRNNDVTGTSYNAGSGQYNMNVRDVFDYHVTIVESGENFEYSCNCPGSLKEKGACKHVVAGLLRILRHIEAEKSSKPESPDDRRAQAVLDYFAQQDDITITRDIFRIEPVITVDRMLGAGEYASLSIRVGSNRMYKVQSLKRFVTDYIEGNNIILGKEFSYIASESEFDRASSEILCFLRQIYELQLLCGVGPSSVALFNKTSLVLSHDLLVKLLDIIGKNTFTLNFYGRICEKCRVFRENPNIKYDLDVVGDAVIFDFRDKEAVIPLSRNGDLIYYNGAVFLPNDLFRRNFAPFFKSLGSDRPSLIFRGEKKMRFLEEVLPRISNSMDVDIPDEIADRYISPEFECDIFFDKYKDGIKAEVKYRYGEIEFSCFENPKSDFYILMRKTEQENRVRESLESLSFEPRSNFYYLKNDNAVYDFVMKDKEEIFKNCTLYYSEDFRKIAIRPAGSMKIGVRMNEGSELLDVELSMEDMSGEELRNLFRALKVRKKYYRLEDGSFIDLLEKNMQRLSDMIDDLGVSSGNLSDNGFVVSKSSAFYLEDALSGFDFEVEKDEGFKSLIDRILTPTTEEYSVPEGIEGTLMEYQRTGCRWLSLLSVSGLGGILADDMGLGKTLQTIVYIKSRMTGSNCFLIVCPSSIIFNWLDEFENFAPSVRAVVVSGTPADRKAAIDGYADCDVLITSYPLLRRDVMLYRDIKFDTVIVDEAQFIKNSASLNARSVKLLKASHRFALTGTPIENSLSELWSVFDFIMPNFLLSHGKFVKNYEKPIAEGNTQVLERLNRRISPFILRRMKKDVLKDLPDKIEEKIVTDLTDEQKKIYMSYMLDIRKELFCEIEEKGMERSRMQILSALTRLRQICCHPSTFIENYEGGSGKLQLLNELVTDLLANDHRVLIFSQFTSMLEIIAKELSGMGISYFCLEGDTALNERTEYVRRFNEGERNVFLVSLKAGGTGLNLVGADTVIHYDPWWNPAVEEQATDRAYRIGQESNVYVVKLLSRGTIEEKIYKLQQKKRLLSDAVIQSKEVFISGMTREELEDVFSI